MFTLWAAQRTGVYMTVVCSVVAAATPAMGVIVLEQTFEDPLPNELSNGPASYVVVNDPSPGWQVQGGTDGAGTVTLSAGVDANGVGNSQALFGNWDTTAGAIYTWNQYTIYGVPGPDTVAGMTVPLNQVEVSLDIYVEGFENDAATIGIGYQNSLGESSYSTTVANNAFTHVVFTLDQTNNTSVLNTSEAFNLRVQHGAEGFGFDVGNILRIDNVLVQTIEIVPVAGDYNQNGVVDAADYTVWRDRLGQSITLPNEDPNTTPGEVTPEDYDFWKANFGSGALATGLAASPAVPEPGTLSLTIALASLVAMGLSKRWRRVAP